MWVSLATCLGFLGFGGWALKLGIDEGSEMVLALALCSIMAAVGFGCAAAMGGG
jgi:hypothetical protein